MKKLGHVKVHELDSEKVYDLTLDFYLEKALENAPKIEDYTIKQLSEITDTPWPITRWHIERLPRGTVLDHEIGRAKVYKMKKKEEN